MKIKTVVTFILFFVCSIYVESANAEIKIGWIGPLTGNAAILGVDSLPSVEMALEEVNTSGGIRGE